MTVRRLRNVGAALALLTAGSLVSPPPGHAAALEEVTGFGSNPGSLQMFRYVPDGLPADRPVVVALHGCTQDAAGYGTNAGWLELADRWGFSVVLPQQPTTNNSNKCFNWFESGDTQRDQGEAASIAQMRQRMIDDTGADAGRVYVSGLSAGGAMTAVMLATYPDQYAGGGVVAGLPFRCATSVVDAYGCMNPGKDQSPQQWGDLVRAASSHSGARPPVSLWHGDADTTVAPANMRESVEQWTDAHNTDPNPDVEDAVAGYPHAAYHDAEGRPVVETYTLTGMAHGQPVDPGSGTQQCGTAADYMLDVDVCTAFHLGHAWGLDT